MELNLQLLDCDYVLVDNSPAIRLFGKAEDGKTVCAFLENYHPYFYVQPDADSEQEVIEFLKKKFNSLVMDISRVSKFLPIGYNSKKTELILVKLHDPSQVPVVRDELLRQKFVKEIFEADIMFKYRFMSDHDLGGMRWYKASGDAVSTTTVKADKVVSAKRLTNIDRPPAKLKFMSMDIEIATDKEIAIDPKKNPIAIISLTFSEPLDEKRNLVLIAKPTNIPDRTIISFKDETEMLTEFVKIVEKFDPDVITGYNINRFDLPYLLERLSIAKISRTMGRCNQKQAISKKFGNYYRNVITGRIIADVYDLVRESVGKGFLRLKRYGLGDVSKELLGEDKVDVAHSEISKFWNGNREQFIKLIEYAKKDSELALRLLVEKNMLDKFFELSKISGLLLQDVLDGGEANRVENLLLKEFNRRDFVLPLKPSTQEILNSKIRREVKGLKGALVLDPVIGLHTAFTVYLDFKSMYPSIFISYNICPTTLILKEDSKNELIETPTGTKFVSKNVRKGILPEIVKRLIDERDVVRNQMKSATDEFSKRLLDAKQYALKVMANSFYGYTGYIRARLYVLDIANTITGYGRFLIQKTKEIVESDKDFKVIYGDTDSIMVETKSKDVDETFSIGKSIESKINKELHGIVQMKIENIFKSLLILSKKRYTGLTLEKVNGSFTEQIVMKGIETVRRDWCDLTSETLYNVLEIMLKEADPKKAVKYVKTVIADLEKNKIPVEKLVITKSISKPLRDYKGVQPHIELLKKMRRRSPAGSPGVGDRIGFVIVQGLQLMSDRAEDPEYVKANNLKIDSKYYMEAQLLPPLERVFEAIGIGKTDILSAGRQMMLADVIKNGNKKTQPLADFDGFVCDGCNSSFRRPALIGKCKCGGGFLFYSGENRSAVIM